MSPSVLCPPTVVPAHTQAGRGPHFATAGRPGDRLDVLLDQWPCPADADAHLRALAAAWTTPRGDEWWVDGNSATVASSEDADAAATLGARLRHVGTVERSRDGVRAWRGLAAVPDGHLLARVPEGQWAAVVGLESGHAVLVAAPVATAADAAAIVAGVAGTPAARSRPDATVENRSTAGRTWLLRLGFAHAVPPVAFVETLLAGVGLGVRRGRLASSRDGVCCVEVSASGPAAIALAIAALHRVHRITGRAWIVL
jgi:hypothetical protein